MTDDYASLKGPYRLAVVCGALPLCVGTAIFLLWLVTRVEGLMVLGVFTLYGGVAAFLVGAMALVRYGWLARKVPDLPRRRVVRSVIACAALLLVNFPVAAVITFTAIQIVARYEVIIHNESPQPLEQVRIIGAAPEDRILGTIAAGSTVNDRFHINDEGELKLAFFHNGGHRTEVIDGYVTGGLGADTTVTINPDGSTTVDNVFGLDRSD